MGPFGFEISEADKNTKGKECQCFMGPFGFEIFGADKNRKEKEYQYFTRPFGFEISKADKNTKEKECWCVVFLFLQNNWEIFILLE
jgi:hypothetical protein